MLNGSTSNRPIGPFQNTVPAGAIRSLKSAIVAGPMSSPMNPSGMSLAGERRVSLPASGAAATRKCQ